MYIYVYIYICIYIYMYIYICVCVLHMCVFHSVSQHIWLWLKIHGDRSFGDTYGSVDSLGKTMPCLPPMTGNGNYKRW